MKVRNAIFVLAVAGLVSTHVHAENGRGAGNGGVVDGRGIEKVNAHEGSVGTAGQHVATEQLFEGLDGLQLAELSSSEMKETKGSSVFNAANTGFGFGWNYWDPQAARVAEYISEHCTGSGCLELASMWYSRAYTGQFPQR